MPVKYLYPNCADVLKMSHSINTLFLLVVLSIPVAKPIAVMTAVEIAKSTIELVSGIHDLWEIFNKYEQIVDMPMDKQEQIFMENLDMINTKLDEMNENLKSLVKEVNMIEHLLKHLPETFQYGLYWNTIKTYEIFINALFKKMEKMVANRPKYENSTLLDFSNTVVSSNHNSVLMMIEEIENIVNKANFLNLLNIQLQETQGHFFCSEQQSPQQVYHSVLNEILLTNSKAFMTINVAYMFKKLLGQGNFTKEIEDATEDFKYRTNNFIKTFKRFMSSASTELWRCDPAKHVPKETYVEITSLLQGFILNEMNLNEAGSCSDGCDTYSYGQKYSCREDEWCAKQPKPGCPKIIGCTFVADEMTICKGNIKSGRRYEYIQFNNGKIYGQKKSCPKQKLTQLHSYRPVLRKCFYCFCLCDEGSSLYSDRYINLRAVITDMENNKVVTGLRFIKHNRIIHLQVQEGQLLSGGQIDQDTVRWIPPEDYHITDEDIYEEQDFHIFSSNERALDLVTIMVNESFIITGVRFKKHGKHIELEVLVTPFNFTTGMLIDYKTRSFFKDSPNSRLREKFGKELNLSNRDNPTRSPFPSIPDKTKAEYIRFTNSDFVKDAAQSTIPFFDAQPVESPIPTPVSGIGIFYKGQEHYGGFIAPKIITYDFSKQLYPIFQTTNRKKRSLL